MFNTSCVKCGKWGYPLDLYNKRYIAKSYLDKASKEVNTQYFSNLQTILYDIPPAKRNSFMHEVSSIQSESLTIQKLSLL